MRRLFLILMTLCLLAALAGPVEAFTVVTPGFAVSVPIYAAPPPPVYVPAPVYMAPAYESPTVYVGPAYAPPPVYVGPGYYPPPPRWGR